MSRIPDHITVSALEVDRGYPPAKQRRRINNWHIQYHGTISTKPNQATKMRPRQVLSTLVLPTAALSLPTSPTAESRGAADAQPCLVVESPTTPTNPPVCWAWYAKTSEPSDYCGATSFAAVSDIDASADWTDGCASIRDSVLSDPRDFLLADYSTAEFNTLLSDGGCAFQVKPQTPPTSDPIYFGGTDITDVLKSAIDKSQGGSVGVGGSMTCYSYEVEWRVVPV